MYVAPSSTRCDVNELRQYSRSRPGIDQTNVSERSQQVGQMDLIYTSAQAVYSCINDTSNFGNLFRWLLGEDPPEYTKCSAFADLRSLFSLRYFTRVWVIQEVALAQAAYLVVNDDVLPLNAPVIERMRKAYNNDLEARHDEELPSVLRWSLGQRMKLGIVSCLNTTSSCHATDPRDHVYAVMGLMENKAKSLIPVDYSLGLEVVYRNVAAATIAIRQDLEILLFSKTDPQDPGLDWRTNPCIDMAAFKSYLDSFMGSSRAGHIGAFTFSSQHKGQDSSPWRITISIAILSPSEFRDAPKHEDISCFIERPQDAPFGLLPRLRVRAHYIDSVNTGHTDYQHWSHCLDELEETKDVRVLRCFKRDTLLKDGMSPEEQPDIHTEDLRRFLMMGVSHRTWEMFSSHYSVGYRPYNVGHRAYNVPPNENDEIFAIDGVKGLFILRKVNAQQYRIVSVCYLWAAWELDCWNPGSKKGRWGPDVKRPTTEQTRMVEIY